MRMASRYSTRRAQLACLAVLFLSGALSAADDEHWLDVEGQIQYGYYTEDLRALSNLAARLDSKEGAQPLQGYYAGLAYFRLALSRETADKPGAAQASEHCVASLDQALQARADWAEALALQGACLAMLAELKPLRAPLAGPRSHTQLAHARALEPHNPRALLLDGWLDREHPGRAAAAKARGCEKFASAIAAFEAARPGEEHVPEWGLAEGYTYRAQCDFERGDAAAARDALERALLIAPEYQLARRLIARITSG
jgi:tetratricopeptide (TPR) repeat protein